MKNNKNRYEEKLFDIPIFTWEEWDIVFDDTYKFYNIEFQFNSMKQYNGCDCSLDRNGELCVTKLGKQISHDCFETEEVWKGFVCQIPEFLEELNKKYNSN